MGRAMAAQHAFDIVLEVFVGQRSVFCVIALHRIHPLSISDDLDEAAFQREIFGSSSLPGSRSWLITFLAARTPPGRPAKIAVCDTSGFTIRPEVNPDVSFSTISSIARTGRCSPGRQTTSVQVAHLPGGLGQVRALGHALA